VTVNRIFEPSTTSAAGISGTLLPPVDYRRMQREIDRISLLKKIVPAITILLLIILVLWPVLNNKEGSFTLAINRLDKRAENAKLVEPRYIGIDKYGQPVSISADIAFRKNNDDQNYYLKNLVANMKMYNGTAARLQASSGRYNAATQEIILDNPVNITTDNNFSLTANQAKFWVNKKIATGKNGVSGTSPFGSFKADKFRLDIDQQILHLTGRVKLHYIPDTRIKLPEIKP